jgi:hypothetical protein
MRFWNKYGHGRDKSRPYGTTKNHPAPMAHPSTGGEFDLGEKYFAPTDGTQNHPAPYGAPLHRRGIKFGRIFIRPQVQTQQTVKIF